MIAPLAGLAISMVAASIDERVTHGYADSGGVKIHYAALGPESGAMVLFLHGFPDFWYSWRSQMEALAAQGYRTVAMDLRGYNLSDKPKGVEQYDMRLLVGDALAVIRANGRDQAIVIAHDWGGAIAWQISFHAPKAVEKLVIVNLPHPRGLARELASNPAQQKASQYARDFQQPDSHTKLDAEKLAAWVTDPAARTKYIEAFRRSDFDSMMNYYRRNYPRPGSAPPQADAPLLKPQCPVLQIHGLKDWALLPGALAGTWDWVDDYTLVTIPEAGHFAQQDAPDKVNRAIVSWLKR